MSKTFRKAGIFPSVIVTVLGFFSCSYSQEIDATIRIVDLEQPKASVEGRFLSPVRTNKRNLVFLREYAGTRGLADRVNVTSISGVDSESVEFRKLIPGEYLATDDIVSWKYEFSLMRFPQNSSNAHLSWINDGRGILMLNDLLPKTFDNTTATARVHFEVPPGWGILSNEHEIAKGSFEVRDVSNAVFVLSNGNGPRQMDLANGTSLTIFNDWLFSDADAATMADSITDAYRKMFGGSPSGKTHITIMRFPNNVSPGAWEADTRGSSVTILSSDMPFKSGSVQRLHEQLRHEIFHLWLPNGVDLRGNYDWFYEGFALYASLKTGVFANQLRFEDYLDSISKAFNVDRMQPISESLIDASKNRWNGANTRVYARGMLVAFLTDIALLERSKGKFAVEDLLRDIFKKYSKTGSAMDGNEAILAELAKYPELQQIIDNYIKGTKAIDWRDKLTAAGLEQVDNGAFINLRTVTRPGGKQKDLLNKLGYNNWRKLSGISR